MLGTVNAFNNKRTVHLCKLVLEAKGDSKKLFAVLNPLCGKQYSTPPTTHDSVENIIIEFGNFVCDYIYIIRSTIGVIEPVTYHSESVLT